MRLIQLFAIALLIYFLIKVLKRALTRIQIREVKDTRKNESVLINVSDAEDAEYEEIDKEGENENQKG